MSDKERCVGKLGEFVKGWIIGDFEPSLVKTGGFEVGVKRYKAGESEERHYHKVAVEYTVIASGEVEMNGRRYVEGDIIEVRPGVESDFRVLKDTVTVVVKLPSVRGDKYSVSH